MSASGPLPMTIGPRVSAAAIGIRRSLAPPGDTTRRTGPTLWASAGSDKVGSSRRLLAMFFAAYSRLFSPSKRRLAPYVSHRRRDDAATQNERPVFDNR